MVINEIRTTNYLTASKIGSYCINPYTGCPHACRYCYASFMKRFTNHPEPWGEFIDVKRSNRPINLSKISGKNVVMSTVTDPYNPYEAKYRITRKILEQLVPAEWKTQSRLTLAAKTVLTPEKYFNLPPKSSGRRGHFYFGLFVFAGFDLAYTSAGEHDSMGSVDQTVEDCICHRRLSDCLEPVIHR